MGGQEIDYRLQVIDYRLQRFFLETISEFPESRGKMHLFALWKLYACFSTTFREGCLETRTRTYPSWRSSMESWWQERRSKRLCNWLHEPLVLMQKGWGPTLWGLGEPRLYGRLIMTLDSFEDGADGRLTVSSLTSGKVERELKA